MKILCIEDGSVDLDALLDKKEWRDDKVIVYRQGSRPPFVVEITENCNYERCWNELKAHLENLQEVSTAEKKMCIINILSAMDKILMKNTKKDN